MKSPFTTLESSFPYNHRLKYYGITITLPANKYFNGIKYIDHTVEDQKKILRMVMGNDVLLYSFEYHPNRNGGLHLHGLIETYCECDEQFITQWYNDITRRSQCNILNKICYIEELLAENNVINWINYIYKEHCEHIDILTQLDMMHYDNYLSNRQTYSGWGE